MLLSQGRSSAVGLVALVVALAGAVQATPISAQIPDERVVRTPTGYRITRAGTLPGYTLTTTLPSVPIMLEEFERAAQGRGGSGLGGLDNVLTAPDKFPRATVDSVLIGLERLALSAEHPYVRTAAAMSLSTPGSRSLSKPMPGTVARMLRVYRQSKDKMVQLAILGSLSSVAEREQALAFVRSVAMQAAGEEDFPGAAHEAIGILALGGMGREGCAALREMHERGLIRNQYNREIVADQAKRGGFCPRLRS